MYIVRNRNTSKKPRKIYSSILLRSSYRDENGKVKKRTHANLSDWTEEEINALEFALKHKSEISNFENLRSEIQYKQGKSVGSIYVIHQIIKKLGIEKALGNCQNAKLAIWQIVARIIEQGSCLSAVRLASLYAATDVINFERSFCEDTLYDNLLWLQENQERIEKTLFKHRRTGKNNEIFLYDVTSSYLEGQCNELAAYGYNRDKKKSTKQIVAGLLCDNEGIPISIELFKGNTADTITFKPQIEKVKETYGCNDVVFVGDRGMIKSKEVDELGKEGFHYITAITGAQIEKLIKNEVFQLNLFTNDLHELEYKGIRYILRKNPVRAKEIETTRLSKKQTVEIEVEKQNKYLEEHPKALLKTALAKITKKIESLQIRKWLTVEGEGKTLKLSIDKSALEEERKLDGCYCLKTDVSKEVLKEIIHARYKDLSKVESAFRASKQTFLEMQPWYVRTEESTRGRGLIIMLAYMVVQELQKSLKGQNLTVEECLRSLGLICMLEMEVYGKETVQKIIKPSELNEQLLKALGIKLPDFLTKSEINVDTRKKLQKTRKST